MITMNISAAALFRTIDATPGTALLIDESDQLLKTDNDRVRELFGLINSGSRRRGGHAIRVVGQGANLTPKKFPTFSPKVVAGIGSLVDTIEDRSVPIGMRRRLPSERIERFREADAEVAAPIGAMLESSLGPEEIGLLTHARPSIPSALNDRTQDAWEPLLAIADLAGDYWPAVAREAALALHAEAEGMTEERLELLALRHAREVFDAHGTDRLATTAILDAFINFDDAPWDEWWGADVRAGNTKAAARRLARLLSAFDIHPEKIRVGDASVRGYKRAAFEDAWARNLGERPTVAGTNGTSGTPLASDVRSVPSVPGRVRNGRGDRVSGTSHVSDDGIDAPAAALGPAGATGYTARTTRRQSDRALA